MRVQRQTRLLRLLWRQSCEPRCIQPTLALEALSKVVKPVPPVELPEAVFVDVPKTTFYIERFVVAVDWVKLQCKAHTR